MKTLGRPMEDKVIVEHLLMNIDAGADEAKQVLLELEKQTGRPLGPMGVKIFASLTRIAENAFYATAMNRPNKGERDDQGFNRNLLVLLGEAN